MLRNIIFTRIKYQEKLVIILFIIVVIIIVITLILIFIDKNF